MNVKSLLESQSQKFPQKCAIAFEDNQISFSELRDTSFQFASYLIFRGFKKQEKIALFLSNTPEAIFSFLGTLSIGGVIVPLDFMLTEEEVVTFLNHSQAKILVAHLRKGIDFSSIKDRCPHLEEIIICGEKIEPFYFWNDIIGKSQLGIPSLDISGATLAAVFYTSGSTGHPKGVMIDTEQLDNPPYAINHFLAVSANDIFLCGGVPFSHVGGFDYILLMLNFASTLVLMERFHPLEFLKQVQKYRVTIFCIVPAMYVAILSLKGYDKFDFSSLRYAVVFGAPSSPELLKKFHSVYPNAQLANGWGMTETAAPNTISPPGDEKIRSIGKFSPMMETKVIDEAGNILSAGQPGELLVKGKAVMPGYFKEPELTKEALSDDGWLKTGDIVFFDQEGFFYIVGRKKDMIKVAGEIVFPVEVEEKILIFPKVREVAVIGVSDNLRGEVPKAFISLKEGQIFNEQELKKFLKEHIAHFKIPHYFEVVENLPKNRAGKIDKTKLKN